MSSNNDAFDPGIDSEIQPGTVEVDGVQTEDPDRLRERAAEGTPFEPGDVALDDGEVRVRDAARRRVAAAGTPFAPESFDVDGDEVQAPDPTERVDVGVFDDDVRGDVEIVNERTGERRDLGADAGGEPFIARLDAPDREGAYRIEIGGETVDQFRVGSAGAAVDRPGDLGFGFNGTILDADRGDPGVTQEEFDPDARRTAASTDPDVVAGAGAADALQADIDPETLSPLNPISEAEGERIASAVEEFRQRTSDPTGASGTDTDTDARAEDATVVDTQLDATVDPTPFGDEDVDFGDATPGAPTAGPAAPAARDVLDGDGELDGATDTREDDTVPLEGGDLRLIRESSVGPSGGDVRLAAAADNRRPEQFGDVDFSAGLGLENEDEVERFTDETLPEAVREGIGAVPGTAAIDSALDDADATRPAPRTRTTALSPITGAPAGNAALARGGVEFGRDIVDLGEDVSRLPGAALEAAELAPYLARGDTSERAATLGLTAAAAGQQAATSAARNPRSAVRAGIIETSIGAAASPVRFTRFDVPTDTGTTSVRALRTRVPGVRDRSLVGAAGRRPAVGTPAVDADSLDLSEIGARSDRAFEPVGEFETDVFQATARSQGGDTAERAAAVEELIGEAEGTGRRQTEFQVDSADEVVGQARRVPDGAEGDIADALRDLDATVFGSAATRSQLPEFREPNDLDIAVPDEGAARDRLGDALEGENAAVSDVFDIKEVEDAPSKARGGEPLKFGRTSQEPREIDGLAVNPASEELIRKAGASGFVREAGAAGTDEFDIGPEPRRPGRTDVREKDVTDAANIGEALLGPANPGVTRFRRAFDESPERIAERPSLTERAGLNQFLRDDRAQAGIPGGRRSGADTDLLFDDDPDLGDAASPVARRGAGSGAPVPIGGGFGSPVSTRAGDDSPSVFGSPDSDIPAGGSPGGAPSPGDRVPGGSPTGGGPTDDSPETTGSPGGRAPPFFGGPGSPPSTGDTPSPTPTPGSPPSDSPPEDFPIPGITPDPNDDPTNRDGNRRTPDDDDDGDDDRLGGRFGLLIGERGFDSGIADAEEAAAALFGGEIDSEKGERDLSAERTESATFTFGDGVFGE